MLWENPLSHLVSTLVDGLATGPSQKSSSLTEHQTATSMSDTQKHDFLNEPISSVSNTLVVSSLNQTPSVSKSLRAIYNFIIDPTEL